MNTFLFALELALMIVCIFLSAFFSGSEMSLFSLSHAWVLGCKDSPSLRRRTIFRLMDNYSETLTGIILGNMFVNSCISMLNDELLSRMNLSAAAAAALSVFVSVVILLFFGEITPMSIAYAHKEKLSVFVAPFIFGYRKLMHPLISMVRAVSDSILNRIGRETQKPLNRTEYLSFLDNAVKKEELSMEEAKLFREILQLHKKQCSDVMFPSIDLVCIRDHETAEHVAEILRKSKLPYLPVSKDTLEHAGFLLSTRSFFYLAEAQRKDWINSDAIIPVIFFPTSISLPQALDTMRGKKAEAALLTDEYGLVKGLITLQDIYSELAGRSVEKNKISDWNYQFLQQTNQWIFDGMCSVSFVYEKTQYPSFHTKANNCQSSNLNGLFCEISGVLPAEGESVFLDDVKLTAIKVENNRISSVIVEKMEKKNEP